MALQRMHKTGSNMIREMHTKVVGVTMENRQESVKLLQPGQVLIMCHEYDNPFDTNALKLFIDEACEVSIGYIARDIAADIIRQAQTHGFSYEVKVKQVTGSEQRTNGVNIVITAYGA